MSPLFIVNPQSSRTRKKGSQLRPLAAKVKANVINADDEARFRIDFSKALKTKPEHIFIEGGDGTVQIALTEYLRALPKGKSPALFTIISGGSTNQIAGLIGLKRIDETILRAILSRQDRMVHTVPLLALSVDAAVPEYGFLFSSGAIPMATDYYQGSGQTGASAVYKTIITAIGNGADKDGSFMKPSPIKLIISKQKEEIVIEDHHLGTITTTLPGFIFGIDPFWGKGDAPLRMTYVGGKNNKIMRLVMNAALKRFDRLKKAEGIESWNADYIKAEYLGPTVLDGEKLPAAKNSIEIRASQPLIFVT